ncbi:MAG: pyridoxal phosphate-dependent aminotransferase [Kiloniellaceae bacterium]
MSTPAPKATSQPAASDLEAKNAYFDRLFNDADLKWLGQNTNHVPLHPKVRQALHVAVDAEGFHGYAPPAGLETLRRAIVDDLDLPGARAVVTDGAVSALAMAVRAFCGPGRNMVTTDPGWKWPLLFARQAGAEITEIPIWGAEHAFRLSPERLAAAVDETTAVIYLVDPNNPLGICYTPEEIAAFCDIAREVGAVLIHDSTYRDFAKVHTPATRLYPEGALTVVSFSKWLGLAGLRIGALVGEPALLERAAAWSQAPLGANVIAQQAALAGLAVKAEWMAEVQPLQLANQARIKAVVDTLDGFSLPVYPSQGNFLVVECAEAGIRPEALVAEFGAHGIMIRQGSYHTPRFGDRFIKVSTTVPADWMEAFCALLPALAERARTRNEIPALF